MAEVSLTSKVVPQVVPEMVPEVPLRTDLPLESATSLKGESLVSDSPLIADRGELPRVFEGRTSGSQGSEEAYQIVLKVFQQSPENEQLLVQLEKMKSFAQEVNLSFVEIVIVLQNILTRLTGYEDSLSKYQGDFFQREGVSANVVAMLSFYLILRSVEDNPSQRKITDFSPFYSSLPQEGDVSFPFFKGRVIFAAGHARSAGFFYLNSISMGLYQTPEDHPFPDFNDPADLYFVIRLGHEYRHLAKELEREEALREAKIQKQPETATQLVEDLNRGKVFMRQFEVGFLAPLHDLVQLQKRRDRFNIDAITARLASRSEECVKHDFPMDYISGSQGILRAFQVLGSEIYHVDAASAYQAGLTFFESTPEFPYPLHRDAFGEELACQVGAAAGLIVFYQVWEQLEEAFQRDITRQPDPEQYLQERIKEFQTSQDRLAESWGYSSKGSKTRDSQARDSQAKDSQFRDSWVNRALYSDPIVDIQAKTFLIDIGLQGMAPPPEIEIEAAKEILFTNILAYQYGMIALLFLEEAQLERRLEKGEISPDQEKELKQNLHRQKVDTFKMLVKYPVGLYAQSLL